MCGGVLSLVRRGRACGGAGPRGWRTRAPPRAAARGAPAAAPGAVLAAARGAVGLGDGGGGAGVEEAWAAASGWRPARAADEVGHLLVRESLRYVIYA